jgi:FkbM family methyltransferase
MKHSTRWLHGIVKALRLEWACIPLSRLIPSSIKLIPLPEEYSRGHFLKIKRDRTIFKVDRSDYMQWHIYTGLPDLSWETAASVIKSGGVVLDIGANCGQFSLKLAARLRQQEVGPCAIHAFEPNPDIYARLLDNLDLNPELKEHVYCHALALGKETGVMSFAYNPANSGGGSITQGSLDSPFRHPVRMERLDAWAKAFSFKRIDFIKVDVEGFEPEVLLGGEAVIEKFRPWLYLEITPAWFQSRGYSTDGIIKKLRAWNYELLGEVRNSFLI